MRIGDFLKKPIVGVLLAILAIVFLSYMVLLFALRLPDDDPFYQVWSNVVYIGTTIFCTALLFSVFMFYGIANLEGKTWGALFAGMLFFLIGEVVWSAYDIMGQDPFPSFGDAFFILGYVVMAGGLVYKLHSTPFKADIPRLAVIAGVIFVLLVPTIIFVAAPILQDDTYDATTKVVSLAYPAMDFFLVIMAGFLAMYLGGAVSKGWYITAMGFAVLSVADVFYAAMEWQELTTTYLDAFWLLSYVLITLGAIYQMELHKELLE